LTTLEYQRDALENANTNTEVLKIMKMAAEASKSAHGEIDIDKVHDLKDEIQEQNDIAKEISDALSSPIYVDEDDLMKELEELEQENLDSELISEPLPYLPLSDLPLSIYLRFFLTQITKTTDCFILFDKAPAKASPAKKTTAEEKELDELLGWA